MTVEGLGRDQLLAELRARVESAGEHPDRVLGADATATADALLAASGDVESDLDALQMVGWLYWVRHDLGTPPSPGDLRQACMYLHPCWQADPGSVPPSLTQALAAADSGNFELWSYLGATSLQRASQHRNAAELNRSIRLLQLAAPQAKADQLNGAETFANLANALNARYHLLHMRADLDAAASAMAQAVAMASANNPRLPQMRSSLAAMQAELQTQPPAAQLNADIDSRRQRLAQAPPDDPDRAVIESELSKLLAARFVALHAMGDLNEAVDLATGALAAVREGDGRRMSIAAGLLAARAMRYARFGDLSDLEEAITIGHTELDADQRPSQYRTALMADLAVAMRCRFARFGEEADIDEAVSVQQDVLSQLGTGQLYWEGLANLANSLSVRYEFRLDQADAEKAVDAAESSLQGIPDGHQSRSGCLINAGRAHLARWDACREPADLDRAQAVLREAIAGTPENSEEWVGLQSRLALVLSRKAEVGDTEALDGAVVLNEQAVALTEQDDPERAERLCNLGLTLRRKWEATGQEEFAVRAQSSFEEAAGIATTTTSVRIYAAAWAGDLAGALGRWATAADDYALGVSLLPQLASAALGRADAQRWLAGFAGLGSAAAACAVAAGDNERALVLFEAGRGVLLSRALDTDEDLAALALADPELADHFDRLRLEMDRVPEPSESRIGLAERRRRAAEEFDRLVGQVREMPGLSGFLAVPSAAELVTASDEGIVAVLNVSRWGAQALILSEGAVKKVDLPGLELDEAGRRASEFLSAVRIVNDPDSKVSAQSQAQDEILAALGWLWDSVGQPVLDAVAPPGQADGDLLGRLWWVPSGPMTAFPLGMMGRYKTAADSVPERAISSYSPTVRALLNVRARPEASSGQARLLGISMPHTEGQLDLPGTESEMKVLRRLFADCEVLASEQATMDAVAAGLRQANWAHFACHGLSDQAQPQESTLLLQDYQIHPLTVVELSRLRLQAAEFAFLSACSTTATTPRLADEAVHITGGCLLAGFRSVIGTLWTIADDVAVEVAEQVYQAIQTQGVGAAATALHDCLTEVRRRYPAAPSLWAAHVHVGM